MQSNRRLKTDYFFSPHQIVLKMQIKAEEETCLAVGGESAMGLEVGASCTLPVGEKGTWKPEASN